MLWEHQIIDMAGLESEPERVIQLFSASDGRQELRFRLDGEYVASLPVEGKITAPEESIIRPGNTGEYPGLIFVRLNTDINGTSMLYAYCVTADNEFFRPDIINPDGSRSKCINVGKDFSYNAHKGCYMDMGYAPDYVIKGLHFIYSDKVIKAEPITD